MIQGDEGGIEMRQTTLVVAVLVGVALLVAVPAVGVAAMGDLGTGSQAETDAAPGEQLAAVVGVQEVEISADIEQRAFDLKFDRATSTDEQVATVGDRVRDVGERIDALEQRKAELNDRLAAGEISPGKYQAEMTTVVAQGETLKQLNEQSARAVNRIPPEQLVNRGINRTAIQTLQDRANNLTGPEVASIARNITGGGSGSIGPPADVPGNGSGPPIDDPGNGTGPPIDDPGNGTGPPIDDPGNGSGPPIDDPGNGTGPPGDGPPGNGTDPPGDGPPGNGTDPPGDGPPGNGTDPPGDGPPGNGTDPPGDGPPGDGPPGNGTGPPGGGPPGDDTSGHNPALTDSSSYQLELRNYWNVGFL
jgi:hypothetical protein